MRYRGLLQCLLLSAALWLAGWGWLPRATAQNRVVVVVNAASFGAPLAPEAIAAAFDSTGTGLLATSTDSATTLPLPTSLAGTTVRINGQLTQLFFASPRQVNFLVPQDTQPGPATIEVRAASGTLSQGIFQVSRSAPGIFTAGAAPAGLFQRVKAGQAQTAELVFKCEAQGGCVPVSLDLGPEDETVALILFGTGLRNALAARVVIGGKEYQPAYAGPQGSLAGLDQVNFLLPRELIGRGRIKLQVFAEGILSNTVELDFAHRPGSTPPRISGLSGAPALAGGQMVISGSGFALNAADNQVRIGGIEAEVVAPSSASQLSVKVPFGVKAGKVSVKTPQGEGNSDNVLEVQTSISGLVTDTSSPPQPLQGVTITATAGNVTRTAQSNVAGVFVLPDVPPSSSADLVIDGSSALASLPYPKFATKLRVTARQDNRLSAPVALQAIVGPGTALNRPSGVALEAHSQWRLAQQGPVKLEIKDNNNNVLAALELPANTQLSGLPPGAATARVNLTLANQSHVPAQLPAALFSPRIVQITPFGATITPGARLSFQNVDNLPGGTQLRLFRLDQTPGSPTLGDFVEAGASITATVSADGKLIETAANAIKETTYYFVAAPQLQTTAIGRVVDGAQPVRQAIVQVRGQNDFTDGNGGFAPRQAAVKQNDSLTAETSYQRPSGGVIFTFKTVPANPGNLTNFGDIPVNEINSNRPPMLTLPPEPLVLAPNEVKEIELIVSDPEDRQNVLVQFELNPQNLPNANPNPTFVSFEERLSPPNKVYKIRLAPANRDIGEYVLKITAQDNGGLAVSKAIIINVLGNPGAFMLSARAECDASAPSGPVMRLRWSQSARADVYEVFRTLEPNAEERLAQNLRDLFHDDKKELTPGARVSYRVVARNGAGTTETRSGVVTVPDVCSSFPVSVSLDPVTVAPGVQFSLPVLIGDLSNREILAYEFALSFDSAFLRFDGFEKIGTVSNLMEVLSHDSDANGLRVLRVGAFSTTFLAPGANRVLLRLRFTALGPRGNTELVWQKFRLNEGNPRVTDPLRGRVTIN